MAISQTRNVEVLPVWLKPRLSRRCGWLGVFRVPGPSAALGHPERGEAFVRAQVHGIPLQDLTLGQALAPGIFPGGRRTVNRWNR